MIKKVTPSKISIMVIMLLMTMISSNLNWGKEYWKGILRVDGKGYYAYLPAVFIYHDLNFGFYDTIENKEYFNKNNVYDYRSNGNWKTINKYYCGTAVAELPFFLTAHLLSYLLDYKTDGYSKLYPIFITIATLFYLFLGLVFLNLILASYHIKEWEKSLVLFAAVFGTNLFYYTVGEPSMSHVYSFAFITMFLYYSQQYFSAFRKKYIPILALIFGIIILIRPINGLILFVLPFIAGDFITFKKGVSNLFVNKVRLLFSLFIVIGVFAIQFVIYKISTGSFIIYSYQDEGFNFLNPHIMDILFSYKKGLFLYTPLYLISLVGGYFLWEKSRYLFISWFGFFLLITYVFSSWWNWYYGGSFSSRVYVEFISVFMILLALALHHISYKSIKKLLVTLIVFIILVCQIQTVQYLYNHIHWSEMTKEKYWNVFFVKSAIKHLNNN
jgi:hypothetical protein